MGFNVGPTSGVAESAELSSSTFSAKAYMECVLNTLANANGSTPPSVILNCYAFLHAMETSTDFPVTMGPDGQPITSGVHQTFNFSFLSPAQKATLKTESDALFATFAETVQDPNQHNAYDIDLVDQSTGKPATLLDLLQNPNGTFTAHAHCHGSIDNPDWDPNMKNGYTDDSWFDAGGEGHDRGTSPGASGITVSQYDCSSYHNGGTDFDASGTGASWESFTRIQPSGGTGAAENTLADFLDKNM